MRHRLVFESFGVVLEVVTEERELFDAIPDALPPGSRLDDGKPTARFEVTRSGGLAGRRVSPAGLDGALRRHVALHAPHHIFIHAGVVVLEGAAIVIPGRSHSGKTTLVAELLRHDALYLSDEYAAVDPEGMIHPFPKPLSIRQNGRDDDSVEVPVPGDRIAAEPVRAGLIVLTSYRPGAEWRPESLPRSEGALGLLDNTVAARRRPGPALAAVTRLAGDGHVISGTRGEASEAARKLLTAVRGSS